ncbi:MAG: hypothetical protein R3C11_24100 [Planctomycetaceae bacterium]
MLFTFTGYQGPEVRAADLQNELRELLLQAEVNPVSDSELEMLIEMQQHLETHREILEAVVVDRAKRRHIVNDVLTRYDLEFNAAIDLVSEHSARAGKISMIESAFHSAQLGTMRFVNSPRFCACSQCKNESRKIT